MLAFFPWQSFGQTTRIITVKSNQAKLTVGEESNSPVLEMLDKGTKLQLLEIRFPNGGGSAARYRVLHQGLEGYITSY